MHKCETCGKEFEGKFCPECGTPAPLEACPHCGAALSPTDKFCPECGKALRGSEDKAPSPAVERPKREKRQSASPALVKACSLLPYATAALFALFSVLCFLMLLGSVSTIMGMGMGSVYQNLPAGGDGGDLFGEEMPVAAGGNTVANVCAALVAFAAFGAVLAGCALAFRLSVPLRVKKIKKLRVCDLLDWGILLVYFIDFLLGCILCGTVDGPLTAPGAGPVCVLVFALFFGLCSAGCAVLQKFLPKLLPAVAAELEKSEAERRAVLTPPEMPERKTFERPKPPKYAGECSDALKEKIEAHGKTRTLFTVFSALIVPLFAIIFLLMGGIFDPTLSGYFMVTVALLCVYGALVIVLGGIVGAMYTRKKNPRFDWQRKRVWNDAAMWITLSACALCLLVLCIIFTFTLKAESYWVILVCTLPFFVVYVAVLYPVAGAIARSGKKLSLAVFGVKHPKLLPATREQNAAYRVQKSDYRAARREQSRAWRKYRRKLAYFEEGLVPPQNTAQSANI